MKFKKYSSSILYKKNKYVKPEAPGYQSDIQLSLFVDKNFDVNYIPKYVPNRIHEIVKNYIASGENIWLNILRHYSPDEDRIILLTVIIGNEDNSKIIYEEFLTNSYEHLVNAIKSFKEVTGLKNDDENV